MEIRKILPYNFYGNSKNKYMYVCDLLMQKIDPPSLHSGELNCGNQQVYTSPRKRAFECINLTTAKSITMLPALNEIPFFLPKYSSKDDFLKFGSVAVRKAFVEAFIDDQLEISHKELQREMKVIQDLKNSQRPVLCVSHTFRMKLVEIYALIGDEIFKNPKRVREFIDPEKDILNFGANITI